MVSPQPGGVLVGYARVSTADQTAGLDAQQRELAAAGCGKIFAERVSATATDRPTFSALLDYVRDGDTVVVTKPDRLARSTADLLAIHARLTAKNVRLRILSMDLDTSTPTGGLILSVLGAVAEFERALMLERQREGIARARQEGRYKGRTPTVMRQAAEIRRLKAEGIGPAEIARRVGVARSGVYRALAAEAGTNDTEGGHPA